MEFTAIHNTAIAFIDSYKPRLIEISKDLFENPETAYHETYSSQLLMKELRNLGFKIKDSVYGLDTAFIAMKQSSRPGPSVAILAEYDALPGIGHGCGHNLIAASSLGGAGAVGEVIEEIGGTIYLFGTPAEEAGGGKVTFCKNDAFNGIDAVIMGHPSGAGHFWVYGKSTLCVNSLRFQFKGKPAHAAMDPHLGVNALDGVIQTFNAINALRQQTRPDARIHGIITDGGEAPNIIPEKASAYFFVRASDEGYVEELTKHVIDCAHGAAIATGTTVEIKRNQGYRNVIPVHALMTLFGEVVSSFRFPHKSENSVMPASTDLGNVSHICPTLAYDFPIVDQKQYIPGHTRAMANQTLTPQGQSAMINAAKVNAIFAIELLMHKDVLESAKSELAKKSHRRQ
ncbi:MAG: M20 family metallopeptidase [Candidatus Ranarchaeia archaeon]